MMSQQSATNFGTWSNIVTGVFPVQGSTPQQDRHWDVEDLKWLLFGDTEKATAPSVTTTNVISLCKYRAARAANQGFRAASAIRLAN